MNVRTSSLLTSMVSAVVLGAMWTCSVPVAAQEPADSGSTNIAEKKVSLNLENADIRYALKLLFNAAGVDYVVDQGVQGLVTVQITDKPFKVALESVLLGTSSTEPLTYRVENGVYDILPKSEIQPETQPAQTTTEPEKTTTTNFKKYFLIKSVDASTMVQLLSQVGVSAGLIMSAPFPGGGMGGYGGGYGGGGYGGMGGMGGMGGYGGMGGMGGGMGGFGGGYGGMGGMGGGMGGFGGGMGGYGGGMGGYGGGMGGYGGGMGGYGGRY